MIKETGEVVQLEGEFIWVKSQVTSSCNACTAKTNCGTSAIAQAFGDKSVVNKVHNSQQAKVGDWVEIGIAEQNLVTGAALVYLLPLLSALLFAVISEYWLSQFIEFTEPVLIVLTLLGGFVGFAIARIKIARAERDTYQVQLIKVLEQPVKVVNVE